MRSFILFLSLVLQSLSVIQVYALDGGTLRVNPRNGWQAFEIISIGENPANDGFSWSMPGTFDGLGAWHSDESTLRVLVNHEISDAAISEVNLDLASFKSAINNTIESGTPNGVTFVQSARQAYDRWSNDGGDTWITTSSPANTAFTRFCSGQSYVANTFGSGRGFVDDIYITGEEFGSDRLFALDLENRDFYRLSGVSGSASGGLGGMPFDSWENAALLDTGETDHVALLLSPDGGSQQMKIFIGEKGKGVDGNASNDFLARNGLAYGSYYYLNDSLPSSGSSTNGTFDTTSAGSLASSKLEDVDTNPNDPTRMVLGDQDSGLFEFDFSLDFSSGSFNAATSGFSIDKLQNHADNIDNSFGDADNVDWSLATTVDGEHFPDGLIFVNEDTGTNNGEIWQVDPNDSENLLKIGDTALVSGATETSGILDISSLVGYDPGMILLTNNQGFNSSLSVLISPHAIQLAGDYDNNGIVNTADYVRWAEDFGSEVAIAGTGSDGSGDGIVNPADYTVWLQNLGASTAGVSTATQIPETGSLSILIVSLVVICLDLRVKNLVRSV